MPKIPASNQAGYKDHTTGTGSVVMSTSNVWSTYLSNTYSSTSSGWDASTGLLPHLLLVDIVLLYLTP